MKTSKDKMLVRKSGVLLARMFASSNAGNRSRPSIFVPHSFAAPFPIAEPAVSAKQLPAVGSEQSAVNMLVNSGLFHRVPPQANPVRKLSSSVSHPNSAASVHPSFSSPNATAGSASGNGSSATLHNVGNARNEHHHGAISSSRNVSSHSVAESKVLSPHRPRITVFGVGGGGCNAVAAMARANLPLILGIDLVAANTDAQALSRISSILSPRDEMQGSSAPLVKTIQLGRRLTNGLGAGARPEVGKLAAEESLDEICAAMEGAHMVFVTAGLGGGTGTGAAPVVARAAYEQGLLTVSVVTTPFAFEGKARSRVASSGLAELAAAVDTLLVVPNQNLFRVSQKGTTLLDAFAAADGVLRDAVRSVTELMVVPGLVNLDFADVRTVMSDRGRAVMGAGEASISEIQDIEKKVAESGIVPVGGTEQTEESTAKDHAANEMGTTVSALSARVRDSEKVRRSVLAASRAISNPLLEDAKLSAAKGVLVNITGGDDLTLWEVDAAAEKIRSAVDPDATVIVGTSFRADLEPGTVRVAVVAAGVEPLVRSESKQVAK
ncbi:mitochondrial cell division protein FtsZ1 [Andalucia godoyi]|uniref:Mitochondrial FtsZ1 n=1 Tax=Andalucia godoyi TaxID=505711 RepID=A0A0E3X155_ANDGO|nr:mitochondrial FtsZ1 [Andalucia godoyi]KAF0853081.1 mitochondrial cell division protein FtsZ1 [Andalucia godoyi]|eukprot:AKB90674.1 mitochondrial cell division protein FtsZ1